MELFLRDGALCESTPRLYNEKVYLKEGKALGSEEDKALGSKYCDIITEERTVTRLRHSKQPISVTIAHATEKRRFLCGLRG
jgi:hypothetical protein